MRQDFRRVAIVNRGHVAMRFIQSVREFNREHGTAIETVALFTEPERGARYVREADHAVGLGESSFVDPRSGRRRSRYADHDVVGAALLAAQADAAWVGWGFSAEQLQFAELCRRLDINLLGPPLEALRPLADKIATKRLAEQLGIPVVPWSGGPVDSPAAAREAAARLGYPVLVKPALGGAGRGLALALDEAALDGALAQASVAAARLFAGDDCFVERRLAGARLISVQTLADAQGTVWDLGLRDGSVQRGFFKVLDEAPAVGLPGSVEPQLRRWSLELMRAAGYRGAGSVEFLVDAGGAPYLLEVNPRLETAHDVVEATTGLDLIKLQIRVARGLPLLGDPPRQRGHAIEVRVRAEDPLRGFAATPGVVDAFRPPIGPGIRVEASLADGDEVPPGFSTMVAKLVASGQTRGEAQSRMERALRECVVVIRGGVSTRSFLLSVVGRDELREGPVDIDWLDGLAGSGEILATPRGEVAVLVAAIEEHDAQMERDREAFLLSAARGRPGVRGDIGRAVELSLQGERHRLFVTRQGPDDYAVQVGGRRLAVTYRRLGRPGEPGVERRIALDGGTGHRVVVAREELSCLVDVDGWAHRVFGDEGGVVRAPAPGMVSTPAVKPGDLVERGAPLLKIEAMKMEMTIAAPFAGRVREVYAVGNVPVPAGAPLLFLGSAQASDAPAGQLAFPPAIAEATSAHGRWLEALAALRQLVLGYDLEGARVKQLTEACLAAAAEVDPADEAVFAAERGLLGAFVDVASLFRRRPGSGELAEDEEPGVGTEEHLITWLRTRDAQAGRLPARFLAELDAALAHYGVDRRAGGPALDEALFWIFKHHQRFDGVTRVVGQILERWLASEAALRPRADAAVGGLLDGIVRATRRNQRAITDLSLELAYRLFVRPGLDERRARAFAEAEREIERLARTPAGAERAAILEALVAMPHPLSPLLGERFPSATPATRALMLEVITARYYRNHHPRLLAAAGEGSASVIAVALDEGGAASRLVSLGSVGPDLAPALATLPLGDGAEEVAVDVFLDGPGAAALPDGDAALPALRDQVEAASLPARVRRVTFARFLPGGGGRPRCYSFARRPDSGDAFVEDRRFRGLHPTMAERLRLGALAHFEVELLSSAENVYLFKAVARDNPRDERLFAFAEVQDLTPVRDTAGRVTALPHLEWVFQEALAAIRLEQARRTPAQRLHWNRVVLQVLQPIELGPVEMGPIIDKLEPATEGLGLEEVVLRGQVRDRATGAFRPRAIHLAKPTGMSLRYIEAEDDDAPIRPLSEYDQKVVRLRQRGLTYPHEILRMLTPARDDRAAAFPPGAFVEHDLPGPASEELVPVDRPPGKNSANLVVGVLRSFTARCPDGVARVVLLSDPSRNLGSLAEPECRRINAALALAARLQVPVEWYALSSGAKIAMDSGTENMDWIALTLRRLIEFTQAGGEINIVVMGINVGGQPYWNAEATMLMHTRGLLIMLPQSAMVLTGKRALDYSGGQSAEDDLGIGGYDRVMGQNGQAQYFATDVADACRILFAHYDHCYVVPGERFPRPAPTSDPRDRDVRPAPHGDHFATVGDVFSDEHNPGRKRPFHIRKVMAAAIDQDHAPLERWQDMRDAEVAVVWDAHIGGHPVLLLGLESEPIARRGPVPADGPAAWTGGTLFPQASKKVARAINTASMNRPVVLLANLSGFDGSPESMRSCQLEFGAEIGRAVVNFRGPIVFCVVSRFHGGAYVVFSRTLNENLEVTALEGTYASVIGGAPAAGVVFAGEVEARAKADARVKALGDALAQARGAEQRRLRAQLEDLLRLVRAEKVGEIADEFDREHSVQRALRVGSLHHIIPARQVRPYLIDAIERGKARELARVAAEAAKLTS